MKKVAVIGAGNVGAHIVSRGLASGLPAEFLLVDMNEKFEQAQVLDLKDAMLFSPSARVRGVDFGDRELAEADIFVITAGAKQQPGENRCQLLGRNAEIVRSIAQHVGTIKSSALVLLVTNPVDILTQLATEYFAVPAGQVFGTGTLLDSSRLRWRLADKFGVHIHDVSGYVLGEHGDSEFVAWSTVKRADELAPEERQTMADQVCKAAYEIIEGKGATYFGIAAATVDILQKVLTDSKKVLPVSAPLHGQYGLSGVSIGVPARIGESGIEEIIELDLTSTEREELHASAKKLKSLFTECPR